MIGERLWVTVSELYSLTPNYCNISQYTEMLLNELQPLWKQLNKSFLKVENEGVNEGVNEKQYDKCYFITYYIIIAFGYWWLACALS